VRRYAALVLSVAMAMTLPGVAQAKEPPFRTVKVTELRGKDAFHEVRAISRKNIWAFGLRGAEPMAYHWNGKKWSPTRFPKGSTATYVQGGVSPSGEVWALLENEKYRNTDALRWNGRAWVRMKHWKNAVFGLISVHGKNDVWVVGGGSNNWHFTGRGWQRSEADFLDSYVPEISADGRYFIGNTPGSKKLEPNVIGHLDGGLWKAEPRNELLPVDVAPTEAKVGVQVGYSGVLSTGRQFAVFGSISRPTMDGDAEMFGENFVIFRSAKGWTKERPRVLRKAGSPYRPFADGHGGFWASVDVNVLVHRTSGGTWTRVRTPGFSDITRVPGTDTLVGVGTQAGTWDYDGFIAVRGQL
jgi:hypothetical protein